MNDIVDDSYQWSEPRDSKAPDLKPYADLAKALAEKDRAYRQLMEKAVRFAEAYHNAHLSNWIDLVSEEGAGEMAAKDPVYVEARLFLKEHRNQSPEVQAWKEHHDEGRI